MAKQRKRKQQGGVVIDVKVSDRDGGTIMQCKETPLEKLEAFLKRMDEKLR